MNDTELYWTKIAAISQAAAAIATFLAVVASLYIAFRSRRPILRLKVGERVLIGGKLDGAEFLMFEVANGGERPVYINGIGWRTGWFKWGPKCVRSKAAVQLTGNVGFGREPPYEVQAGAAVGSYAELRKVLAHSRERVSEPFFTRDWPLFGRQPTRVLGYAYTADGHIIHVKPEKALLDLLIKAEIDASRDS
jgi:hypothetical protein